MPDPDPMPSAIEPRLIAEIRQFRRSWFRGALGLAGTLAAIVAIGAVGLPPEDALQAAVLAAVLGLPVIAALWIAGARDPSKHPALRALRARAGSVVWIYTRLYHGSFRLDELVFAFEDGSVHGVPAEPARSRDLLEAALAAMPRATIGFSPEAADAFLRAPRELYRPTPQRLGRPTQVRDTAWLVPYAASTYRMRRVLGVLGVLMVLLGGLGIVIVAAAASPRDQPALLMAVFAVSAVLPGVLLVAHGFARFDKSVLASALRSPEGRIRELHFTHQADVEGDYVEVAAVTLSNGRTEVFSVPKRPERAEEARR